MKNGSPKQEDNSGYILCVDDEEGVRQALRRRLSLAGYRVATAASGPEGLACIQQATPDVIISDQQMPGLTGLEFLRQSQQLAPDTVRIMLTGYAHLDLVLEAINDGTVARFLTKPWDDAHLERIVADAMRARAAARQRAALLADVQVGDEHRAVPTTDRGLARAVEMAAQVAHEIKNSLTIMQGAYEMIDLEAADDFIHRWCQIGLQSTERVLQLTYDLLNYSRGLTVEYRFQQTDLNVLLQETFAPLRSRAISQGLRWEEALGPPMVISADPDRLREALFNVALNAVEVTKKGQIRIATEQSEGQVRIHLADTGPGIPEEVQGTLFQPFVTAGKEKGTGLGLATTRTVVERHDGEITFTTRPGRGTTFTITLPAA
jgi:signal transduction histidine kinase